MHRDHVVPPPFVGFGSVECVRVDVVAHFGAFEGHFADRTGRYMWHCHMVEHEDYDMMRPFVVRPAADDEE